MQSIYIATIFAGALVCMLSSLLLLVRRKPRERSRLILAIIVFFSVLNYIPRFIALSQGYEPEFVVSAKMLLLGNFMVISYILYPIEVIRPGWLNLTRTLKLYAFWLLLLTLYLITSFAGVRYSSWSSLPEMFAHMERFEVWFCLFLSLLLFAPGLLVIFIQHVGHNSNTDRVWLKKYAIAFYINILAYLMVLTFNHPLVHTLYYYVSVGCSLFIVYMELFDRLLAKTPDNGTPDEPILQEALLRHEESPAAPVEAPIAATRNAALAERLDAYMTNNSAWRDPDLSLTRLASELYTNRTTLSQTIQECGYENYTHYINQLRIRDFLQQVGSGSSSNYQDAFFFVGFRSRNTALRNFKQFTGTTPSDYFQKLITDN
jgi:AraC-like DNA-binding protein